MVAILGITVLVLVLTSLAGCGHVRSQLEKVRQEVTGACHKIQEADKIYKTGEEYAEKLGLMPPRK